MPYASVRSKPIKSLILCLGSIASVVIIVNIIGHGLPELFGGNLIYIPVTVTLFILTIYLALRFGTKSAHGKAWIMFLICAISWMIAEDVWMVEELVFHQNPFPSIADLFYVIGYLFLIMFSFYYVKMARNTITRKRLFTSVVLSISVLIPSLHLAYSTNSDITGIAFGLALSYPVLDFIVLVPALVGIMVFFRGEASRTWTFFSFAILSLVIGDTGFLITQMNNTYYTGHPIEIFLVWSYVLFSFGVNSQIKMFSGGKNTFENKNDLV